MARDIEFTGKGQALRLSVQQALGGGPLSIFGEAAQQHDLSIREVTAGVLTKLAWEFPNLEFRQRNSLNCKVAPWKAGEMAEVMLNVARTSLKVIDGDLAP